MNSSGVQLRVVAPEGYRSPTVTVVEVPDGVSAPLVVDTVKQRGWVIGGGYGKLKPTTFRIGHMGEHTVEELEELLSVLAEILT